MLSLIYDISKKVFRASDGSTIPGYAPAVSFGEKPVWAIQLVDTSQESPLDLSGIYSWRAAMDTDFSSDTEPMARTVSGITATMGDFGPVVSIPIETATLRFLQICNGRQKTSAYFELAGLDGNGDTVFYVCFPVSCLFPIDPVAAGVLEGVDVTTLTQSQVEAIASAAAQAMLGQDVRDAVAQAMEGYDPYPDGGTAGQVLTKTANGAEWADAPSGGSSGESSYTLPPATPDTLGGVKVGRGLSITEDGTLSATGASGTSQAEWGGIGGTLSDQSDLQDALDAKADSSALTHYAPKADSLAGYGITDAYTKDETDAKVSSVYRYKGSISTYAELPADGNTVGDVWNVASADEEHGIKAGDNVAWTGDQWDALSGEVDLTPFALKAEAGTDHNHDGKYIPVTGCPLTNFSVEGKRADGSSIGTERIKYTVEDRTDNPVDNLTIKAYRFYIYSGEVTFKARPLLGGRAPNQAGGFVISDYNTGNITAPGDFIEGDTKLSDKYAAKSHAHAMGDITGLPASGGTAGQVLTKTDTGAEWADASSPYTLPPATPDTLGGVKVGRGLSITEDGTLSATGTSGEAGTDAGAVRVVKNYADYLDVSSLASEQAIHHSATFIPAADVTGDTIEVRKAISGEVTDDTLRKGRIYVQIDEGGTGSGSATTREVTTSTYVVEKVRFVDRNGGADQTIDLLSGREDAHYIFPDSFEKASAGQYGITFKDREPASDAALNGGWPTVAVDISKRISAYKEELEREGTYIGRTPWYLADAGVENVQTAFKKMAEGYWMMGYVSYDPSTGKTSESFTASNAYDLVFLYKDSTGSYVETPTPNATETSTEPNTGPGNPIIACLDITPEPLRLAIQALEGTTLEVSPGKAYSATLTANATLTAAGGEEGYRQEAFLDVTPGAFTLTPGSGISFAQDLTAGKVNHCRIVWTGTSARLLVDDVTDAPASGGESGGETGGESGGDTPSDGWPTKIVISGAASTQGSDVAAFNGDYVRTGETLSILGETVPIWSNGSKYIYGMSSSMGSDLNEPAIALQDSTGQNDAYMSYYYRMKSGASWERADAANAIGMTLTITEE